MFKNKSKKSVAILFSILTICFNVSASNNKISDKKITVQQKKVENYVPWKILLGFGLLGTGIYFAPKLKSLLIKDNKIFVFDLMKNSVDCIKYSEYRARIKATKEIMMAERNEINKGKIDIINDCISISYPEIEAIRECLNKILKKDDQAVKEIVAMREKIEKIDNPLFKTIKDEILDTISLVLEAAERNDVGDHYDNERYAIPNFEVNALPIYETQEIDGKLQFILENNKNEPFVLEIDESDKIIKMSGSVYSYENLSSIIEMALKGKEAKGYNLTIDKDLKFYKCMNINSFKDNIYKKINPKNTTITNGAEIILHNSGKIWVFKSFNNEKIELSCGYSKKNMSGYKAEYALTMEGKTIKINSLCEDDNCEKCGLCEENEENPLIEESINEFLKIKDIEYENPYITDYEVHFIGNDKKELEIRGEYF
ncbi:MAG: hypothetical protein FWC41_05025, partial [Firmicutes bacterium]|nr:hypothetical protein [Bacillota bacterium]